MIEIINLKKIFNGNLAFENLNLKIEKGEIYGFVGSDGAGKTTILRILSGVLNPSSGDIILDGVSFLKEKNKIREKIAYVPQRFGLYEDLTLLENLNFYSEIYGIEKKGRGEKIEEILNYLKLKEFKGELSGKLSGGMKQKLSLACSLISNPEILIIDEPTVGLDPGSRMDLWKIFQDFVKEKKTIVLSTSYFEEGEKCGKVALLHKGKILVQGNPEEIRKSFPFFVLEVVLNFPKKALEEIKGLDFIVDLITYGDKIHIILKEISFKEKIIKILNEKEFQISKIDIVSPSMEDIFIFYSRKNGK